jgi:NAD-dependent deacetylase
MDNRRIVVFTGAGVSAESGLQTFRNGGLWESHDPRKVATPEAWAADPGLVLRFYNSRIRDVRAAQPNAAHLAIARLEEKFHVDVVTQNVDNLHERAGSTRILHLHGSILEARSSIDPSLVYPVGDAIALGQCCEKGSQLRPNVVWFGEAVEQMPEASQLVRKTDLLIVVGTSLQVSPACDLVRDAHYTIRKFFIDPGDVELRKIHLLTRIRQTAAVGVPILVDGLLTGQVTFPPNPHSA